MVEHSLYKLQHIIITCVGTVLQRQALYRSGINTGRIMRPMLSHDVFSGSHVRALETTEILSAALGIPYQVTDALREYDCGILEEKSDELSWGYHNQYYEDWVLRGQYTSKPEGGECFLDIQKRFVPFIEELAQRREDKDILLVGHGGLSMPTRSTSTR